MSRTMIGVVALAILSAAGPVRAHDGHEKFVLSGTIKAVNAERIEVETFDETMMQFKRVWIVTDAKTKYVRSRKPVDADTARPASGDRVAATVGEQHAEGNLLRLVAVQLELTAPKK